MKCFADYIRYHTLGYSNYLSWFRFYFLSWLCVRDWYNLLICFYFQPDTICSRTYVLRSWDIQGNQSKVWACKNIGCPFHCSQAASAASSIPDRYIYIFETILMYTKECFVFIDHFGQFGQQSRVREPLT